MFYFIKIIETILHTRENINMKLSVYAKNVIKKLISFYSSGTVAAKVTMVISAVAALTIVTFTSMMIISALTGPTKAVASKPATTFTETTSLESTTKESTTEETTTEETTTEEITTEETTEEPTTIPETIAIEDLNIGDKEQGNKEEESVDRNEFQDFEEPTEPETETEAATETPTEPPVSEYACIVKGIDVSKWNSLGKTPIDWGKVKASGVEFVIIRAGFRGQQSALLYEDPYFNEHMQGALSAGLQVGVYFYSQAITETEALEEASYLLSLIKDYKITYPVCFDWEPVGGSRAGQANLSKDKATSVAKTFLSTIKGYGYDAMLYSYHAAIKKYYNMDQLSEYKTWLAYYFSKYKNTGVEYKIGDELPDEPYPYQMWQYTSTGTVPGIQGIVDINVAFFSYSGSNVPTSAIKLNLPSTSYTTNIGVPVDYKKGVKAYNTAGMDVSSSVTTAITNSKGEAVQENDVFKTPGTYTITYTIKDFTGAKKSATAKLTVRKNPEITLENNELTFYKNTSSYEDILTAVKANILSAKDNEGNDIDISKVVITGFEDFVKETETTTGENSSDDTSETTSTETSNTTISTSDSTSAETFESSSADDSSSSTEESTSAVKELISGTYTVTYTVKDSKNATGTATVTIIILDEEQTTTDVESASATDTTTDTTTHE